MYKTVKSFINSRISKETLLEKPKSAEFGHLSTPIAFSLAKELKKNPKEIAKELSELFKCEMFDKIETVGGYINFHLSETFLDRFATEALKNPETFAKGDQKEEKILLEYVSANPTGPLHIGHARGAIIGDVLYRVAKHLGYSITSEYYINDAGNQIRLLGLSIHLAAKKLSGLEVEYPENYYKGEYIEDLAKLAMQKYGKKCLEESFIETLSEFGKDLMLEEIKDSLKSAGIVFDRYVSEKEILKKSKEVLERLKLNNAIYTKEGKEWLKSEMYGDEKDRVVVRESGEPTYLAGDIVYHDDKFARGFDRYINIWGADHHGYIARVKAAIRHLGYDDSKLEIILSQMVSLLKGNKPYKMSKRAGSFILMRDVLEDIGKSALRFMFISKSSDTHLEFDVDDLSKEDSSNPIFYINYAYARINTLLEKSSYAKEEIIEESLDGCNSDLRMLLFESLLLQKVLEEAFAKREMQKISDYLKNLASMFHAIYNKERVIGSNSEKKILKIFLLTALSIKTACDIIGVELKERM